MMISEFLLDLSEKLDRGPVSRVELKSWALKCRDYATIAQNEEQRQDQNPLVATTSTACRKPNRRE